MTRLRPYLSLIALIVALVLIAAYASSNTLPRHFVREYEPQLMGPNGSPCTPFRSPGC